MKRLMAALTMGSTLFLGGCGYFIGERVEVPPAHYGKVQTKNGFNPDVINPSRFRLPYCFIYCDKLYLVESSDFAVEEIFRDENALFMPKSDLVMPFDVRGTFAVKGDPETLNAVFDRVPIEKLHWGANASGIVKQSTIYQIYGQPIVRDVVRQIVAKYTIDQVSASRESINAELTKALNTAFEDTPITIRRFGLADVRYPKLVLEQKETAARRRIAIEQEEAEKQIRLVKAQADLEVAKQERAIRREKAQAALEENQIFSQSVTPEYLAYRDREVLEQLAQSPNAVFVPMEALGQVGLNNKIFGQVGSKQ